MDFEVAVLDPGTLLSFTTSGVLAQVAGGSGLRFLAAQVYDSSEALAIPSLEYKVLEGGEQLQLLLKYATVVTQDEASAAALAQSCSMPLVSDEPKLRRVFASFAGEAAEMLSTPELFQRWEKRLPNQKRALDATIIALSTHANYSPAPSLPGSDWLSKRRSDNAALRSC